MCKGWSLSDWWTDEEYLLNACDSVLTRFNLTAAEAFQWKLIKVEQN